jgi:N-acetyl-anhydromuramyl-L-alanine amidase AmpD
MVSTPALALKSGKQRSAVNLVVLHATGGPACDTKTNTVFFTPAGTSEGMKNQLEEDKTVGTHYIVGKEGEVLSSVPENEIASHVIGYNESLVSGR